MNGAMVNVALPSIQQAYGASEGVISWVVTGYFLVFAVGIPLYGRLSDLYSLRRTFLLGLAGMAVGSLLCALAPNLVVLITGRVIQGAGAAAIPALASATVARLLPAGERGVALGLIVSSVGVGAAVGPVAGGLVTQFAGWQVLFYATMVLTLFLIPGVWSLLPDEKPPASARGRFDLTGGILLALSAGLLLFGVTEGEVSGFASFASWGSFLAAIIATIAFVRHILRTPDPFISPSLLKNRVFLAVSAIGFLSMVANISSVVFVPLLLSQFNGLSPGAVGLVLTPGAIAVALLSPVAGRLSDQLGMRAPILSGLALMLISAISLSSFGAGASPWIIAVGMLGIGSGFAGVNSPITNAASAALPSQEIGVGLGIFQMIFFLGGGFGPALIGSFMALRSSDAARALNPFYSLNAAPFSDAFLLMSLALLAAVALSIRLPGSGARRAP